MFLKSLSHRFAMITSDFSVIGDYAASWKYIKEDYHSLERHTNLGICFDKVVQEENGK